MQRIKNERFTQQIKATLGGLYDLLKEEKGMLAGGAVTSLFCNREINDWDIYCRNKTSLAKVMYDTYIENDFLGPYELMVNSLTGKSLLCGHKDTQAQIQFITFDYFDTPEALFNTFDFTVCMGAYLFETDEFVLHDQFLLHNSQRYLKYNPKTAYPMISALRVQKYKEKGYSISKLEMMRIIISISQIDIKSWEDAENHLGGSYGQSLKQLSEGKGEFSIEGLLDTLGVETYHKDILTDYNTNVGFEEVMDHLNLLGEKRLYTKRVSATFRSVYAPYGQEMTYKEGEVMNGGPNGIYCQPAYYTKNLSHIPGPNLVVLEPVGLGKYYNDSYVGDMLVKKIVPWNGEEAQKMREFDIHTYLGFSDPDEKDDD